MISPGKKSILNVGISQTLKYFNQRNNTQIFRAITHVLSKKTMTPQLFLFG